MTDAPPLPLPPPAPAARRGDRLDKRVVVYWMLSGSLFVAVLAAGAVIGVHALGAKLGEYRGWIVLAAWVLIGGLGAAALVEPVLSYHCWRFSIGDELLEARYGVLFREEKVIPINRLQHVDLMRGPIERLFGLSTLVVFTAGTEGATFRLPGLAKERAKELRDRILAARGDDVL
jgi:hypothetical protein